MARPIEETAGFFSSDSSDLKRFDGSRLRAEQFYKREYIVLQKGEPLPVKPGSPTTPAATGGRGGAPQGGQAPQGGRAPQVEQAPQAGRKPYTGKTAPPGHDNAELAPNGFWYVKTGPGPTDFSRVMVGD